jgi:membrane protease YdiL (CAAX protease family)
MRAMSVSARLALVIALTLAVGTATAGLFKAAVESALPHSQWAQHQLRLEPAGASGNGAATYDLGRAFRRYLLVLAAVALATTGRWVGLGELIRGSLPATRSRWSECAFGLGSAMALVVVYGVFLLSAELVSWDPPAIGRLPGKLFSYGAAAATAALIEELFFRGVILVALRRDWGAGPALLVSSACYSLAHGVSGSFRVATGWDPTVGLALLGASFGGGGSLFDPRLAVGLGLVGLVLGRLALATGAVWAPLGFHAGLVLAVKLKRLYLEPAAGAAEWLAGDIRYVVSGVATWPLLLVALAVLPWLLQRRRG